MLDKQGEGVAEDLGDAAIYRHHDVTSEADWAAIVDAGRQEFGHIDVLVNNAGVFRVLKMLDTSLEEYRRVTEINQTGVVLGMKAVAPVMIEQGNGGSIINISSVAGLRGAATTFAYGASKWAVRGMTKGVARELAEYNIRVNSVHPGLISTQMLEEFRAGSRHPRTPENPDRAARPGVRSGRSGQAGSFPGLGGLPSFDRRRVRGRRRDDGLTRAASGPEAQCLSWDTGDRDRGGFQWMSTTS